MQGYFSDINSFSSDCVCGDKAATQLAIANEVERTSDFLQACVSGKPFCAWILHEQVLKPLAYDLLNAEGMDMATALATMRRNLADSRTI